MRIFKNHFEALFDRYIKGKGGTQPAWEGASFSVQKGGTEQLLPEESSPFYGDIRYPSGLMSLQYFTYRKCPTKVDGKARIKSIRGNTLVWNQGIPNGNFTSTSGWYRGTNDSESNGYSTYAVADNILTQTYSVDTTQGFKKGVSCSNKAVVSGHIYVITYDVKYSFRCRSGVLISALLNNNTVCEANVWTHVAYRNTVTNTSYPTWFCIAPYAPDLGHETDIIIHTGDTAQYKNVCLFDLTTMFGSGNEPTIEEFKSLFPLNYYAYNSGSLLNFNGSGIKTTGKNLLNCQWTGTFSSSGLTWTFNNDGSVTINGTSTSAGIMCWNYQYSGATSAGTQNNGRKYIPNGEYILSGGISNKLNVQIRVSTVPSGGDTGFISAGGSEVHVTIDDTYPYNWVRLMYEANKTFNNETCYPMIRYDTAEGGFEPYHTETSLLPISTYFPTGMKSAGSVYDELSDKAITRVGSVDLGSLTWSYNSSGQGRFESGGIASLVKRPPNNSTIPSILCSRYNVGTTDGLYASGIGISIRSANGYIWVVDSSQGTDASAFKTAMSGVYLNYELATYTEQDVDPEDTQIMLNRALSTILGRNVSVDNPQQALNILMNGE